MKVCKNCNTEKEVSEFYHQMGWCKKCHNQRMIKWQKENPENAKKAWTKGNRKRASEGRVCPCCKNVFKIATSQEGCSLKCRFNLSFKKSENGCWEWTKYKSGRKKFQYASIWINRKRMQASHISYEMHKGNITQGLYVLHTCDNPSCVNPDHLYLGTHQQNMDDMNDRGRGNKNRWHFRKYLKKQCLEVIKLRDNGKMYREISEIVGIPESSCKYIYKNPHRLNKEGYAI